LPGMEFFCGRGFLTMDGDVWRHARRALRPSFAKSNLLDLSVLSREVDKVVANLPKNGGPVDLQPLFYVTVCFSFWPLLLYYIPLMRYSF
jgi:cytochrome P450